MKVLIDIGHPAHVHLFKNIAQELLLKGLEVLFSVRAKGLNVELLEAYQFKYVVYGVPRKSAFAKVLYLFKNNYSLYKIAKEFKPNITLSHSSFYLAQVSWFLRIPNITLEDSRNMEQVRLYLPFTKAILTPSVLWGDLGKKQIRYKGFHELAYLHPNQFDSNIISDSKSIDSGKKIVLLRFITWNASHDRNQKGFSNAQKKELVDYLASRYQVYISSEDESKYKEYAIPYPPQELHMLISKSEFVISEGATMAAEAGVLGIPSIYVNSIRRSYNEDLEKYGLVYNFQSGKGVLDKIKELEAIPNRKDEFQVRRQKMLSEKIDVTPFLVWFIENYPESAKIMKEKPDETQARFR